jgi:hypothetical protein
MIHTPSLFVFTAGNTSPTVLSVNTPPINLQQRLLGSNLSIALITKLLFNQLFNHGLVYLCSFNSMSNSPILVPYAWYSCLNCLSLATTAGSGEAILVSMLKNFKIFI